MFQIILVTETDLFSCGELCLFPKSSIFEFSLLIEFMLALVVSSLGLDSNVTCLYTLAL